MSTINISDFDGTITLNSPEIYKDSFGISPGEDPKVAILKGIEYIKNESNLNKYLSEINKKINYRKKLIEYLKTKNPVYIISENPFVKKLMPSELKPIGIYSTIIPEIVGGEFTGKIKETTKVDVIKTHLPKPNGAKIKFHTDGGSSDEELIEYLEENYKNIEIIRY